MYIIDSMDKTKILSNIINTKNKKDFYIFLDINFP